MKNPILCIVELENDPEQVVARAAWLARLFDRDLELVLSEPIMNYLGESFVYLLETQKLAESVRGEQEALLDRLARSAEEQGGQGCYEPLERATRG